MSIIDLSAERDKRDGPDEQYRTVDTEGRPMFAFLVHYRHNDRTAGFSIWAYSKEDAFERIGSIAGTAQLMGQLLHEV